jgi:hypothetical protein
VIAATIAALPAQLAAKAPAGPVVVLIGRVFADYAESGAKDAGLAQDARELRIARQN